MRQGKDHKNIKQVRLPIISVLCVFFNYSSALADSTDTIKVAEFSKLNMSDITPPGWSPLEFNSIENKTAYFLTRESNKIVVQATSHSSASGLFRKIQIPPQQYPTIRWSWKVNNIINKGNILTKNGDDYPARIYISFYYDPDRLTGMESIKYKLYSMIHNNPLPLAVINYVWSNHAPIGTIVNNAYSERVKMIVVQSGNKNIKLWRHEERNLLQDYKQAFGEKPGNITGIAIMTDTDNTGESATSWYGDISFFKSEK